MNMVSKTRVRASLKKLLGVFLRSYEPYYIFSINAANNQTSPFTAPNFTFSEVTSADLDTAGDTITDSLGYAGDEANGFALLKSGRICCIAWFWHGNRYRRRNFWPLQASEAKLVHIVTDPEFRGKGLAPVLLQRSVRAMSQEGFCQLYARIWHSNHPSIRAFEKAGWKRVAFVLALNVRGLSKPLRFRVRLAKE